MKKILLWTFSSYDWKLYNKILLGFFSEDEIELVNASIIPDLREFYGDICLALLADSNWYQLVKQRVPVGTPIVWINHTIDVEIHRQLMELAREGRKISLVADTPYYAEQRKNMLVGLGIPESALECWYSGMPEGRLRDTALIFERSELPEIQGRKYIYFNGRGLISPETLIQIAVILEKFQLLESPFFKTYCKQVKYATRQIGDIIEQGDFYAAQQNKVINGFLFFEPGGLISCCNYNARAILGKTFCQLIGLRLPEVFPFMEKWMDKLDEFGERVIKFQGRELVFDLWQTETHGVHVGYIMMSNYQEEQKKELRLRTQMLKKRNNAKYTFASICGESNVIERCRQTARKFANSKANVLITGATGTGKELFASAIHNASRRKDGPFVAVNCGALVESLLESELFGYEGGAFTGARKEGKAGLFELAHKGTVFLDEIEAMPIGLQVKLLRMLQEKEVVRVGGSDVIPIDIRIIAATNLNLMSLIEQGIFREDLYYRLNVLPLYLPTLNERREDILPLFYFMRDEEGYLFRLDEAAEQCVQNHYYRGNVRELKNCVEYLGSLEQADITYGDLPDYLKEKKTGTDITDHSGLPAVSDRSSFRTVPETGHEDCERVLEAVKALKCAGKTAGRRSIAEKMRQEGCFLSEMQIRILLKQLEAEGKIELNRGRKGISLREDT